MSDYIFVSHANLDKPDIRHIVDALIARGHRIWLDNPPAMGYSEEEVRTTFHRIRAGNPWRDEIDEALRGAVVVLVCWSPRATTDRHVWMSEATYARTEKKLIACRIDDLGGLNLPDGHSGEQVVDVRRGLPAEDLTTALVLLIDDIDRMITDRSGPSRGSVDQAVLQVYANTLLRECQQVILPVPTELLSSECTLTDLYVGQRVLDHRPRLQKGATERARETSLGAVLRNEMYIRLLGRQGAGKGQLLRHTAAAYAGQFLAQTDLAPALAVPGDWARHDELPQPSEMVWPAPGVHGECDVILPLFIDVRRFTGARLPEDLNLRALIEIAIAGMNVFVSNDRSGALVEEMARWIDQKRACLLIVDGIDERRDRSEHRQLIAALSSLSRSRNSLRIIWSARIGVLDEDLVKSDNRFHPLELLDFKPTQIKTFIGKFCDALRHHPASAAKDQIHARIARDPELLRFAGNPWMAALLVAILSEGRLEFAQHGRKALLLREAVFRLASNRATRARLPSGGLLFLGRLAAELRSESKPGWTGKEFRRDCEKVWPSVSDTGLAASLTLDEVIEWLHGSAILRQSFFTTDSGEAEMSYQFVYPVIEEHLTAEAFIGALTPRRHQTSSSPKFDVHLAHFTRSIKDDGISALDVPLRSLGLLGPEAAGDLADALTKLKIPEAQRLKLHGRLLLTVDEGAEVPSEKVAEIVQVLVDRLPNETITDELRKLYHVLIERAGTRGTRLARCILPLLDNLREGVQWQSLPFGFDWLESAILDDLVDRLSSPDQFQSSAASIDIMDWAARQTTSSNTTSTRLDKIVQHLVRRIVSPDIDATAAAWALYWLGKGANSSPAIAAPDAEQRAILVGQIANNRLSPLGTRYVAQLIGKLEDVWGLTDALLDWAEDANSNRPVLPQTMPAEHPFAKPIYLNLGLQTDPSVRLGLARACGRLGNFGTDVISTLAAALRDPETHSAMVEDVAVLLSRSGSAMAEQELISAYARTRGTTRGALCLAVRACGCQHVLRSVLQPSLSDRLVNWRLHSKLGSVWAEAPHEKLVLQSALPETPRLPETRKTPAKAIVGEIRPNWVNAVLRSRGHLVHKLKAKDSTGRWAYYFVLVQPWNEWRFLQAIEGDGMIDLEDYGSVIASCYGESPNAETVKFLKATYGWDATAASAT